MKHWQLEIDEQGIAWLTFDQAGTGVNTLNEETLGEFDALLAACEETSPAGLVVCSAKAGGFISGADVRGFAGLVDPHQVEETIHRVHAVLLRLESLPLPSVAMIDGHCLGGGLELALACTYRVVADSPDTRLGFPEVQLGIFPGFGGSVRSLRALGHLAAMDLMLTGRRLSGRAAKSIGLVDECVPPRQLRAAVVHFVRRQPARQRPPLVQRAAGWSGVRPLIARALRRRAAAHAAPAHYPAPNALIEHWRRYAGDEAALYRDEATAVARLLTGATAQNLVRLFLLRERLRAQGAKGIDGKPDDFQPRHLHVVGAGAMGGDIAAWGALRGLTVSLQDREAQYLTGAMQRAYALFARTLKEPRRIRDALDRLIPDARGDGVARADVVLEAIVEDVDAKHALFRQLSPRMKPGALLASNTSSIPLEALGAALERPEGLVGLHFFNPVAKMPLLEIVRAPTTDAAVVQQALVFAHRLDKLPLLVRSGPGFLVNRILMPYLLEAVALVEEGVAPEAVDRAAIDFGMPVGPVELADTVGLDICLAVAEKLAAYMSAPVPASLRGHVEAKRLGRKSGHGYYRWQAGRALRRRRAGGYTAQQSDRIMLRLLNEAVACLREGVVASADELDAGMVFGAGFAPFRGGPLNDLRHAGVAETYARLNALYETLGERFEPDVGWQTLALG